MLLACLALLCGLHQAAATRASSSKLTVLAYMMADNDLQCDIYKNLMVSIEQNSRPDVG